MTKTKRTIPLIFKIFSIAVCILMLIEFITVYSYIQLRSINREVVDLAEYAIPLGDHVTQMDLHVLKQEIYQERIMRLFEVKPLPQEHIDEEFRNVSEHHRRVLNEISKIRELLAARDKSAVKPPHSEMFNTLKQNLAKIEKEYQEYYSHFMKIAEFLKKGENGEIYLLEDQLTIEEDHFDQEIDAIRVHLNERIYTSTNLATEHQQQILRTNILTTVIAVIFGLVIAYALTLSLVRPIHSLKAAMRAVDSGDLNVAIERISNDEIGLLANTFRTMVGELIAKEKIKCTFGKYIDPRVVKSLINQGTAPETGGQKQAMTVVFSDIIGWGLIKDQLAPEIQIDIMNKYLTLMSEPIARHHGILDKFIDTMVMAFWGPPFTSGQAHPRLTCEAALDQVANLKKIEQLVLEHADKDTCTSGFEIRIGIATGSLIVGNMGSKQSKSYTVLGDTVNISSRLKGVAKQYGIPIIMNEDTRKMIGNSFRSRELDIIQVIGKAEPIRIFELMGRIEKSTPKSGELIQHFEKGLDEYRQMAWGQATSSFEKCLQICPNDKPAAIYLERIKELKKDPPEKGWNGISQLTRK